MALRMHALGTSNRAGLRPEVDGGGSTSLADNPHDHMEGTDMAYRRSLIGPLALLIIGVLLLMRNLGYLPSTLDQWWPAILILIGLWILLARSASGETATGPVAPPSNQAQTAERHHHAPTGGLILVGLGLALLAGNLFGGRITGALIVVAVGLALLIARAW